MVVALALVGRGYYFKSLEPPPPRETAAQRREHNSLPAEALQAIANGELTLYSMEVEEVWKVDPRGFHGWRVLGKTAVTDPAVRGRMAETLRTGLEQWDGRVYACFAPRHALRARSGGRTFDFLVCFECGFLYYYPPGGAEVEYLLRTKPGVFNEVLIAAKIPQTKF